MSLPNLTIPQRELKLVGAERPPLAKANFRALIEIERVGGGNYIEVVNRFLSPRRLEAVAVLMWGMTATYRYRQEINHPLTEADRRSGFLVPETFLAQIPLPTDADFVANYEAILSLLKEIGVIEPPPEAPSKKKPKA